MNNELQVLKTIESKLPVVSWVNNLVVVNGDLELQQAKSNLLQLANSKKEFVNSIKEIKEPIFDLHKKIVAYEKENLAIGDKLKADQDAEIADYNRRVYEAQKKRDAYYNSFMQEIKSATQKCLQVQTNLEKYNLQLDLILEESKQVPIADKIDKIEEIKQELEVETIVPEIVHEEVTLTKKSNQIDEVKKYFISDEKAFIEYCLKQSLFECLDIKIKKSESNKILESLKDKNFISYELEYKK